MNKSVPLSDVTAQTYNLKKLIIYRECEVRNICNTPFGCHSCGYRMVCEMVCMKLYACALRKALLIELADIRSHAGTQECVISRIILQDGTQVCNVYLPLRVKMERRAVPSLSTGLTSRPNRRGDVISPQETSCKRCLS